MKPKRGWGVEPKHRMYLNNQIIELKNAVMEVEPKHRMYLNIVRL